MLQRSAEPVNSNGVYPILAFLEKWGFPAARAERV
jgi:hypothetical protein